MIGIILFFNGKIFAAMQQRAVYDINVRRIQMNFWSLCDERTKIIKEITRFNSAFQNNLSEINEIKEWFFKNFDQVHNVDIKRNSVCYAKIIYESNKLKWLVEENAHINAHVEYLCGLFEYIEDKIIQHAPKPLPFPPKKKNIFKRLLNFML